MHSTKTVRHIIAICIMISAKVSSNQFIYDNIVSYYMKITVIFIKNI